DRTGRTLVSGSLDRTVRIWDVLSDTLLHTLRLPVGPAPGGRIEAVALSPDGSLGAAAATTGLDVSGTRVYLFQPRTGRLLRHLGDETRENEPAPGEQGVRCLAF